MKNNKTIFILSILAAALWLLGQSMDVYKYAIVGAIFEMLWLPLMIGMIALVIMAFIKWTKEKFALNSYNFFSILILCGTFWGLCF